MAAAYAAENNAYIPNHEASGKLIVDFARNPSDFSLLQYTQMVPVKQSVGYYLKITPDNAARIVTTDGNDHRWPDGQNAPLGNDNHKDFEFDKFATTRYIYPYTIGSKTVDQASWDIDAAYSRQSAQQEMTEKTLFGVTALTTAGNYPAAHTATATALAGGKWDVSTTSTLYIKKSLMLAAKQIQIATLGVVKPKDLHLVISPALALLMGNSQEIHDYLKGAPSALAQVRGDVKTQNGQWGLPDRLYGFDVTIEDCVRISSKKGAATLSSDYVLGSTVAVLVARVGSLEGLYGSPSFSYLTCFAYEEMTVESKNDTDNRRRIGRVISDYAFEVTAPSAGYLFTAVSA